MREITLMRLVLREVNICNNGLLARRPQRIHGPQRAIAHVDHIQKATKKLHLRQLQSLEEVDGGSR